MKPATLGYTWPTLKVDLNTLFEASDKVLADAPAGTAGLKDRDITRFFRLLQRSLETCETEHLGDYRLQVSTYARRDGHSDTYSAVFLEANGQDTSMWVGDALPNDIHREALVARIYTKEWRPFASLTRWGQWLYITETPLVAPLSRSTDAHRL